MKTTLFALIILIFSQWSEARGKLDISAGFFTLQAKTSRGTSSVSGPGSYQLAYRYSLLSQLEMMIGYSMIASKIYTGDLGFGPDIGLLYYPFTSAYPIHASSDNVIFKSVEFYKPYVGGAFHQRQYQSTQSTYAGFSVIGGSEYALTEKYSLKGEARLLQLVGPSQGTATEIDLLVGFSFLF